MKRRHILLVFLIIATNLSVTVSQTPRRRTPARAESPKPTPIPAASPETKAASATAPSAVDKSAATLGIVNGTTITSADIESVVTSAIMNDPDLYLRDFYQDRDKAIREARQRALDARINSMLIAAQAKKGGLTIEQFLEREINNKIAAPGETEIRAVFDTNRAQLGNDLESVRVNIVNYLCEQRRQQLYGDLVNRLKMTNTVMKHADVNTPNLAPGTVLAAVDGQPIRIEIINERMKAYIYRMETQIYSAKSGAVNRRVNDLLLIAEANRRHVGSEEIVRTEITEKMKPITDAEIARFYEENKQRINEDLASARAEIANYLEQQQQEKLNTALAEKLRAGARFQIFLKEPVPPIFNVTSGKGPARGDATAKVNIIEFTDFQCSACGAMYPAIEDVLKNYGNRVHFEIRNFPLASLHANAFNAAEAAAAANAQGKFWEYIDLLFKNQNSLDVESLKKFATQVGLDRKRFDADFDGGKFDADIRRDIEEGELYGVESTPTIFINGVMLTTLSADGLREAIEKGFARAANNK